jgi:MoaA/NifB/PqqE/SkfB family radical SAM enzyme
MTLDATRVAIVRYPDPRRAARALGRLAQLLALMRDGRAPDRCATAGGRCYAHLHAPGWPSRAFVRHIRAELEVLDALPAGTPVLRPPARLQALVFAVTRKCELHCDHCCEWSRLNQPESLSKADIARIVARFRAAGVTQVHFSGGEPLCRLDDILEVVRGSAQDIDFWLLTSGRGLDVSCARRLRSGGIRGINVSLDHFDPAGHDAFRGTPGAFDDAIGAARAAQDAGLALSFTLVPTRDFVTRDNLRRYGELAGGLCAGFIQILEPRPVGRFAGRDVELRADQVALLDGFCDALNGAPARLRAPLVVYPARDARRLGCLGSGRRYVYVDTDGLIHPCPFCRGSIGSALDEGFEQRLATLRDRGCLESQHPADTMHHGEPQEISR